MNNDIPTGPGCERCAGVGRILVIDTPHTSHEEPCPDCCAEGRLLWIVQKRNASTHVILPRAEVEALRARCERLRRLVVAERRYRDANTGYPGTASGAEVSAAAREWVATRDSLDPGDLADDVRDPQETTLV